MECIVEWLFNSVVEKDFFFNKISSGVKYFLSKLAEAHFNDLF